MGSHLLTAIKYDGNDARQSSRALLGGRKNEFRHTYPNMTASTPRNKFLLTSPAKRGRPAKSIEGSIRTKAWARAVGLALGTSQPGAIGRFMQREADARHIEANHETSKRWNRYFRGEEIPDQKTRNFVDLVLPGSAHFFKDGPSSLWFALWGDLIMEFYAENVERLINVDIKKVDVFWLSRMISLWRTRAFIASSGALRDFPGGLYEMIVLGMGQATISTRLDDLGVLQDIRDNIRLAEERNILGDVEKRSRIVAVGCVFSSDPISLYLSDPVQFMLLGMDSCERFPQVSLDQVVIDPVRCGLFALG